MPTNLQAALNPNDLVGGVKGGLGFQKKQFAENNQHIFHHNAVLGQAYASSEATGNRNQSSGRADPMGAIPLKPNAMNYESASQLQKKLSASPPAGGASEFRKASPDLQGPYSNGGALSRHGQPSAGQRAANAMMSDFSRPPLEYSSSI